MKKLGMFGKSVPLVAILVSALLIGSASAAILDYYGRIRTTATVQQSVLVDGYDYSTLITDEFDVSGGCCECRSHYLENTACVSVDVMFDTDITPEPEGEEIFVGYYKPLGYTFEGTTFEIVGNYYPVDVTVEDGECEVTWTFDMGVEEKGLEGSGHWGYGLAISLDGVEAAFQIHNNDGTDASYDWGTHLWSPYHDGSWHSGDPDYENVLVDNLDWVTCSGERDIEDNPEGIFTVTISKCMLSEEFCWAVWFGVGGFYNPNNGYSSYPEDFMWQGDVDDVYACCDLLEELDEYVTLLPDERLDFIICYCFAPEIMPGSFVITTTVYPD